jgi:hypothetical protein
MMRGQLGRAHSLKDGFAGPIWKLKASFSRLGADEGGMKLLRSILGILVGLFFAGIVVVVVWQSLPAKPCSPPFTELTCRSLSGTTYHSFGDFLNSQPASLMYGLGIVGGAIGGFISG